MRSAATRIRTIRPLLSVWDRLFGSRSATLRTPDMPIGTEGLKDRGLAGLLARPFEER